MAEKEEVKKPISTDDPTDAILDKLSNLSSGIEYEYEEEPKEETVVEKKETEEPPKEEDNPLIKAIETSTKAKKEEKEEPKVDTEKLKTEVLTEVTKLVTGKTPEELAKAKEETPIWVTEQREPTQKEIIDYTKELTKRELKAEQEEERKRIEEEKSKEVAQEQTVEEASKERAQSALQQMGRDVAELAVDGKLPAIVDENNKDDVGVAARTDLYDQFAKYAIPQWNAYNQAVKEGKSPEPLPMNAQNIRLFFYEKYKPKYNKSNPGKDAPIAGVVPEAFTEDIGDGDFAYDEILEARKKGVMSLTNKPN